MAAGPLYAFTPNGTNLWTSQTNNFAGCSPAIAKDGTIYVATSGGSLCAFAPDGTFKWQVLTNGYIPGTTPAIDSSGTIYYLAYSTLYSITPAGAVQWALSGPPAPTIPQTLRSLHLRSVQMAQST